MPEVNIPWQILIFHWKSAMISGFFFGKEVSLNIFEKFWSKNLIQNSLHTTEKDSSDNIYKVSTTKNIQPCAWGHCLSVSVAGPL